MPADLHNLLGLISINGLGPRRIIQLLGRYPDLNEIWQAPLKELCEIPGIDMVTAQKIRAGYDQKFVERQLRFLQNQDYKAVTYLDEKYPSHLKNIYDPPVVLFSSGDFIAQDADAIAIVGTRTPSTYGREVTTELVRELVAKNLTIISGFARGIDTEAHKTAIKCGGRTIAVLGNGIDQVYPPENRHLRDELIAQGVYCSEFPFETKPDAVNFPRRNRIISGMSLGVVVIEAGEKSGALLTAYYALDQNREVFAIPGRITDEKSQGTNRLIQKGAKLVRNSDDIIEEIEEQLTFTTRPRQLAIQFDFANPEEKTIYDILTKEPLHIDEIANRIGKTTYEILATLLGLELKGAVRQLPGKMFIRN